MTNILIVEDDFSMARLMEAIIKENSWQPHLAKNGLEALEIMETKHIDLIITDVLMPVINGYMLVEQLRETGCVLPILMVTAKDAFDDKKKGFVAGTDDYMVKPIDVGELVLRIKALLRRARIYTERKLTIGKVTLYYDSLLLIRENERIELPQKEFYLLYKLLSYPDQIFTRLELMDEIWGRESKSDTHTINVHINRLRERLELCTDFEIKTIRGLGYKAVKKASITHDPKGSGLAIRSLY